ncbi:hypothetical protein BRAO285_1080012 [Bradyrhizobium sp. ORS 285]|nr:hypothetical protein BRAO285_1080012 [Bradyrhizobium sp. ORS 285]
MASVSDRWLPSNEYLGGRELLNYITTEARDAGVHLGRVRTVGGMGTTSHVTVHVTVHTLNHKSVAGAALNRADPVRACREAHA